MHIRVNEREKEKDECSSESVSLQLIGLNTASCRKENLSYLFTASYFKKACIYDNNHFNIGETYYI